MLEALEKIKFAEEQNERKKEKLLAEMAAYEAGKKQLLLEKREQLKTNFSTVLSDREEILARDLEMEERDLALNAEAAITKMEENYHLKKEETIQKIIERVISEYGSQ